MTIESLPPSLEELGRAARALVLEAASAAARMEGFLDYSDPGSYLREALRDTLAANLDGFEIEPRWEAAAAEAIRGLVEGLESHLAARKRRPVLEVIDGGGEER